MSREKRNCEFLDVQEGAPLGLVEGAYTIREANFKEGDIFVSGEDALGLYTAREVIKAIGRGFNPDVAKLLLKQDYVFEVVNLPEYVENKESMIRLKGRVIGKDGKARKLIEQLTGSYMCVYGKTISIIGEPESTSAAKRAVESLLRGATHANVYKWLEKRRREIKIRKILNTD